MREFEEQMREQERALSHLMSGQVSAEEVADYVRGIMDSGRPCRRMPDSLFWGFDEPETMPADSRVLFYYIPTNLNTAFMMQAYRMFPERVGAVPGFALYDLGYYPGILHDSGESRVYGEMYEVSDKDFERICRLEGNGVLYQCESVAARSAYSRDEVMVETFVYLGSVKEDMRIKESDQPWGVEKKRYEVR